MKAAQGDSLKTIEKWGKGVGKRAVERVNLISA
jgi:hypothetical protein